MRLGHENGEICPPSTADPGRWQLGKTGEPELLTWSWLPETPSAGWFVWREFASFRLAVPRLSGPKAARVASLGEQQGYLPRHSAARARRLVIAYQRDIESKSTAAIEAEPANRRVIRRDAQLGRALFAQAGALPWALWPAGELPADWWRTRVFQLALVAWAEEARFRRILRAVEPGVEVGQLLDPSLAIRGGILALRHSELPPADRAEAEAALWRLESRP